MASSRRRIAWFRILCLSTGLASFDAVAMSDAEFMRALYGGHVGSPLVTTEDLRRKGLLPPGLVLSIPPVSPVPTTVAIPMVTAVSPGAALPLPISVPEPLYTAIPLPAPALPAPVLSAPVFAAPVLPAPILPAPVARDSVIFLPETPPSFPETLPEPMPLATVAVRRKPDAWRSVAVAPAPPPVPIPMPHASAPVFFANGSSALDGRTIDALGQACRVLGQLPPGTRIEVTGHTDRSGDARSNEALSLKRATAVGRYLVETCSVPAEAIRSSGMGERMADQNRTRSADRRVEFRVLR